MYFKDDNQFIEWWAENRTTQKSSFIGFLKGFSKGLAIGTAVAAVLMIGWYKRANMVASSKLNYIVFFIALFAIALFMAWLQRNFNWEMNEQRYIELIKKREKGK